MRHKPKGSGRLLREDRRKQRGESQRWLQAGESERTEERRRQPEPALQANRAPKKGGELLGFGHMEGEASGLHCEHMCGRNRKCQQLKHRAGAGHGYEYPHEG